MTEDTTPTYPGAKGNLEVTFAGTKYEIILNTDGSEAASIRSEIVGASSAFLPKAKAEKLIHQDQNVVYYTENRYLPTTTSKAAFKHCLP